MKRAWVGLALAFVVLETWALTDGAPNDSLTQVIHFNVPAVAVFGALAWLAYHFWRTYRGKGGL